MIADDKTGLTGKEVRACGGHLRFEVITLVELAIDFGPDSIVDYDFVKRHGLFGKSRFRADRSGPDNIRYGERRSGKLVRCYFKAQVNGFRVELELHSTLLRKLQINEKNDLPNVVFRILPKHLLFVRFEFDSLHRYLLKRFGDDEGARIFEIARKQAKTSIHETLKYLRSVGVLNAHRLVTPMKINQAIENAIMRWVLKFSQDLAGTKPIFHRFKKGE